MKVYAVIFLFTLVSMSMALNLRKKLRPAYVDERDDNKVINVISS